MPSFCSILEVTAVGELLAAAVQCLVGTPLWRLIPVSLMRGVGVLTNGTHTAGTVPSERKRETRTLLEDREGLKGGSWLIR